jgi:pimeloyl-ACP methyl ester carboxylesterase
MFIEADGIPVHYVEQGSGPRTAVFLHGFPVDHRIMTGPFEPVFARRDGWRRIYLDLPGMGYSPAPAHIMSTDDVLTVVRGAIDALVPGPCTLVGESYGGYLARGILAVAPERFDGLCLLCPMIVAEHAARDVPEPQVLVNGTQLTPSSGDPDLPVVQTPEVFRRVEAEVSPGLAAADQDAVARIRSAWTGTFPLEPQPWGRPTLFLLGRQDSSTGYRDPWTILESYPRATFAVLDRAGHNLQIEQQALFEALVHEWLDRVEVATTYQEDTIPA